MSPLSTKMEVPDRSVLRKTLSEFMDWEQPKKKPEGQPLCHMLQGKTSVGPQMSFTLSQGVTELSGPRANATTPFSTPASYHPYELTSSSLIPKH